MNRQHYLCTPPSLPVLAAEVKDRIAQAQSQKAQYWRKTVPMGQNYWDNMYPGTYEHWRVEQDWDMGFNDAMVFFGIISQRGRIGQDKVGTLDL